MIFQNFCQRSEHTIFRYSVPQKKKFTGEPVQSSRYADKEFFVFWVFQLQTIQSVPYCLQNGWTYNALPYFLMSKLTNVFIFKNFADFHLWILIFVCLATFLRLNSIKNLLLQILHGNYLGKLVLLLSDKVEVLDPKFAHASASCSLRLFPDLKILQFDWKEL